MYILQGTFEENSNAFLSYIEKDPISVKIRLETDENGEEQATEIEDTVFLGVDENGNDQIVPSKKVSFLVYSSEEDLNNESPEKEILVEIAEMPNANSATPQEIIEYMINNKVGFTNLNLI